MKRIKYIYLILAICQLTAKEPGNLDPIVYNQMLLLISKLDSNPILWQDTREGYLRNRALRVCDTALDNIGMISTLKIIETYYPELDSLLIKIRDGKEFDVYLVPTKNYQVNYFYSSSRP